MPDDDVKKLPPEDRIKKLKELEQKRKKEIEEAQKIIQDSENELTDRRRWREKVPIPEVAQEDLVGLSETAREILKVQRGVKEKTESKEEPKEEPTKKEEKNETSTQRGAKSNLEETLAREKIPRRSDNVEYGNPSEIAQLQLMNSDYTIALSQRPAASLYQDVRAVTERAATKGYFSWEEQRQVTYWTSAMERKLQDVEIGKYEMSTEEIARTSSLIEEARSKMMGAYKTDNVERKGHDWYKSG